MILRYSLVRHKHGIFKTMTELTVALLADLYAVRGSGYGQGGRFRLRRLINRLVES